MRQDYLPLVTVELLAREVFLQILMLDRSGSVTCWKSAMRFLDGYKDLARRGKCMAKSAATVTRRKGDERHRKRQSARRGGFRLAVPYTLESRNRSRKIR